MSSILKTFSLAQGASLGPWPTLDPFLFCVHHDDAYPKGNEKMAPDAALLRGRNMGQDFEGKDGFRMYHGHEVPGFPQHPHRGFETVTIARRGYIDHSDSLGAAARFGQGDVQWLTAGGGVVHSEMFPLLSSTEPNPVELFQIWLNLPAKNKMVKPYFSMLWSENLPEAVLRDDAGKETRIRVIAGTLGDASPPPPPPDSWASDPKSELAIWSIRMPKGAKVTLPASSGAGEALRTLYFFAGSALLVEGERVKVQSGVVVKSDAPTSLEALDADAEVLVLQGRPIGEPVAQHGPFVMNTRAEIQQAFMDYQRTQFGGWPWPKDDPSHPRDKGRFARHADGREETR